MSVRSILLAGATLGGLAALAGAIPGSAGVPPALPAAVAYTPDSTPLFGPKQFDAPASGSIIHTERFLAVAGTAYLLMVVNGAADGSGRVSSATIRLNSAAILSPVDFAGAPALLTRFVQLTASDTLKVEMSAGAGQFLTVSVLASANPRFPVHGPAFVTVQQGSGVTVTGSFALPADAAGPYHVHVVNGPDGTTRVVKATVKVNGTTVLDQPEINPNIAAVERAVTLTANNTFEVKVQQSSVGSRMSIRFTATDTVKPLLTISAPSPSSLTRNTSIDVSGSVDDRTVTAVTVNGLAAAVTATGAFTLNVPLGAEGVNTLQISAVDANGNRTDSTRTVTRDTSAPVFDVWHPVPGLVTREASEVARGPVSDLTAVTVTANGVSLAMDGPTLFNDMIPLVVGENVITFVATDAVGNSSTIVRTVVRDVHAPALVVSAPLDGSSTSESSVTVTGTVSDETAVGVTVNGDPATIQAGAFAVTTPLAEGPNAITIVATDAAGNTTTIVRSVTRATESLPPDPSTVAPPLDRTVATTMAAATEFLYTGASPIQTGVAAGTIDPKRVAVLRGGVKQRDGSALPGVEITILDRPEFGRTLTRADGAFDIAVNGGGLLTVNYEKSGFLPVQRQVKAPWQDYEPVDDVVMVPLDTVVTMIDFSAPMQVARGSVVTDADGLRQATVMFPQGTQATMVMADGTTQGLSAISVRATEYTVGESGPNAMPGLLPPTSGYTYAAELSVDEALVAGAKEVRFDRPVPVYVENFIGFPVGTRVPVASYDRTKSAWIPSPDGRVIKVVGTSGGLAQISVDTSGAVADSLTLAQLGMNDAERERIAALYSVGQTLWRMPVIHFSPLDGNFPDGPPGGAVPPDIPADPADPAPRCEVRSIIECTTQVLGEDIGIVGTPLRLAYRSNRVPGYRDAWTRRIKLTGPALPPNLIAVELSLEVAGRVFTQRFPAQANQAYTFAWDGRDAYGRPVQGERPLIVRVGYVYPMLYFVPAVEAESFGLTCYGAPDQSFLSSCVIPRGPGSLGLRARQETTLWTVRELSIGSFDVTPQGNGGWEIDEHHTYDPVARVLHYGDGTRRVAKDIITTVAGTGARDTLATDGPALERGMWDPTAITVGRDGTVYFLDLSHRLRKVTPDGFVTTIAGTGVFGYSGDGGPATQARIQWGDLASMAVGPDRSIYLAQPNFGVVRKIDPVGIITTVAGNPAIAFCVGDEESDSLLTRFACVRDGSSATEASLWGPYGVAVGPDGSIYIADGNHMVRKVSPNGIISTIAGGGHASYPCDINGSSYPWESTDCGDGGAARLAGFDAPRALAVGPDGNVYVTEFGNATVRRISADGVVTRVAGVARPFGFGGDGGLAVNAQMGSSGGIAVAGDGTIYFADEGYHRIRSVSSDGIITTIAGTGATAPQCGLVTPPNCTTGGLAAQTSLNIKGPIALGPDGSLYFGTFQGDYRIRRLVPFFRSFTNDGFIISSEDGTEVFEFDARGRHLRTRDALTNRVLFEFGYEAEGRLDRVTDADGNATRLERDSTGRLIAVVGPFGQRTTVGVDGRGWLASLVDPAGDTVRVQHDSLGLLLSLRDAKGNPPHAFVYDSLELLVRDTDPAGGFASLTRQRTDTSLTATLTTVLGRQTTHAIVLRSTGAVERTRTDPAGLVTRTTEATNGTTTVTSPDGTLTAITERPDPRFGMQAPVASQFSVRMPSGLQLTGSSVRKATLTNRNDPLSLMSQVDSLVMNGRTFTSVFDAAVRTLTQTSAEGRQVVTQLDTLGRGVEERVPGAAPVRYGYGPRGFLTTVTRAGRVLRYDYDSAGRVRKVTDPLGRFEQYAYDSVGRVVRQTLFDGSEILYGYDANGNLTSLTPPGRPAHVFAYTVADLDSVYTPPAAGLPNPATRYTFNLDRQLMRVLRPDSLAIDVAYDTAGRPSRLTLPNGQVQFAYSPTGGNLTTLTAADGGTLTYAYDGSLPTSATWAGTIQGSVGFKYDSDFRVSKIAVNGTDSVAFGYDRDNLLTSAGAMTLTRDPQNGRLIRTVLASDTLFWSYDDSTGAVSRYTAKHGATTLFDVVYTRDSLDRIVQMVETVDGVTTTKAFTYDSLGRLDQVRVDGVLVSDYGYDANGNRTSLTTQSGTVTGTYDDQDRMLTYGGASYSHTANGELRMKIVGSDTTLYSYDVLGNLLQVRLPDGTVIDYLVDAQNRRVGKRVNGVLVQGFLYQGQLAPVAELNGAGQVVSRFVYATRVNVPDYLVKGGTTYRLLTDYLGSVRLVVNAATGAVAQALAYDEYGRKVLDTNQGFQPFGYAGGIVDAHTSLVRLGARDLDVQTGRWTVKDPLGFGAGGSNLYPYAGEDPINRIDPTGLQDLAGVGNFLAGFGDSMSLGLTKAIRQALGWDDYTDYCSTAYTAGKWTEVGAELAFGGVSQLLKRAAGNVSHKAVRRAATQHLAKAGPRASRGGKVVHHSNPLFGHPVNLGGGETLFPTGGLPTPVHSGSWNRELLSYEEHMAAHRRMMSQEEFLRRAFDPRGTVARAVRNLLDECRCGQ